MNKRRRKFSKFQLVEPDCKGQLGLITVRVYKLSSARPKVEFERADVPDEIKAAVKIWVKSLKYGGMSLTDYLNAMFEASNYV